MIRLAATRRESAGSDGSRLKAHCDHKRPKFETDCAIVLIERHGSHSCRSLLEIVTCVRVDDRVDPARDPK